MVGAKNKLATQRPIWVVAVIYLVDQLLLFLALHAAIFLRQYSPVGSPMINLPVISPMDYALLLGVWGLGILLQQFIEAKIRGWKRVFRISYLTLVLSLAEYILIGSFSRLFLFFFPLTNFIASVVSLGVSLIPPGTYTRFVSYLKQARGIWMGWVREIGSLQPPPKLRTAIHYVEENTGWIFPIILVGLGGMFFWPSEYRYSSDVGYYLSLAKNFFHGQGYVNPDLSPAIYRGPIFTLLLSASYLIFGESLRSALTLERIFWVLTILATYHLGKEIFGNRAGFLAALFVLFAGAINFVFGLIWTDGPLLFLLLSMQFLIWKIYKEQRRAKWYILLGMFMGLAYLLKQTALFMVPLPLLMWLVIRDYRTRQNLGRILLCYIVFACFVFGWMGYVYLSGGSAGQITKEFNTGLSFLSYIEQSVTSLFTGGQVSSGGADIRGAIRTPIEILIRYYDQDLAHDFGNTALLFPIVILYTLYRAIFKRSEPDIFLGIGLLLFGTLIPVEVNAHFGTRHNIYFYVILLIACAAMIERLINRSRGNLVNLTLGTVIVVIFLWNLVSFSIAPLHIFTLESFHQPVEYFTEFAATAEWIDLNIDPNDSTLVRDREGSIFHILTSDNRSFELLNLCQGELSFRPAEACVPPYVLFWLDRGVTDPDEPREYIWGISEPWLISFIRKKSIDYVIVTPRVHMLFYYLEAHPDFEEVARVDKNVIFRVNGPVQPISSYPDLDWEGCIGIGTPEYLQNLKRERPETYKAKLTNIFGPWMGLNEDDIESYENWRGCVFDEIFTGEYKAIH